MKTETEIKDMIEHFERDANDKEETTERQAMYGEMVKAMKSVVNSNEQEVNEMITKFEKNPEDQAMVNALKMVLD